MKRIDEGTAYLNELIQANQLTWGKDRQWRREGRTVPMSTVRDILAFSNARYKDGDFERALSFWLFEQKGRWEDELRAQIQHDGSAFDLTPLLNAVLKDWDELDEAVFRHTLWAIKRGLWNLRQEYDIMPTFLSPVQGGGKSTFAEKVFVRPLAPFSRQLQQITELADNFAVRSILSNNIVVFVDELAKGEAVDGRLLKKVLTQRTVESRIMHSEEVEIVPRRTVFMGGSNQSIADIIIDPTGMRRFWDFKCRDRLDWDFINQFDPYPMYRAIDEQGATPALQLMPRIFARQDLELRRPSGAEAFIRERCAPDEEGRLTIKELMQEFNSFCNTYNYQRASRHLLSSELKRLGVGYVNSGNLKRFKLSIRPDQD